MILLDTCALIWWTLDPMRLSPTAKAACDRIETTGGAISSISIWEIGVKIKNKKLDIGLSLTDYVDRLKQLPQLDIIPVDDTIWLANLALEWNHRDPADRTIVATAKLHHFPIVTCDNAIADFYKNTLW